MDVNISSFSHGWYLLSLKKEFMDVIYFFPRLLIMDMFYIFESKTNSLILYCLSSCNYFLNNGVLVPMDANFLIFSNGDIVYIFNESFKFLNILFKHTHIFPSFSLKLWMNFLRCCDFFIIWKIMLHSLWSLSCSIGCLTN